jgi:hypothetical protein
MIISTFMSSLNRRRNEDDQENKLKLVFDQEKRDHCEIENTFIKQKNRT